MKLDHVPSLNVADAPTQDDADWYLAQLTGRDPSTLRDDVASPPPASDDVWMPVRPAPRARGRALLVALATALVLGGAVVPLTLGTRVGSMVRADSAHSMPAELRGNAHPHTRMAPPVTPAGGALPGTPATNDDSDTVGSPEHAAPPLVRREVPVDQPTPTETPTPTPEPTDPAPGGEPTDTPSSNETPPVVPSGPVEETPSVEP